MQGAHHPGGKTFGNREHNTTTAARWRHEACGMEVVMSRGEARTRNRTRTFRPNYLSFAGTYQCNLDCPHCCVPIEWPDRLPIPVALRFLDDCAAHGVGILGFTGGEPFIYPEFLHALCRRAAE